MNLRKNKYFLGYLATWGGLLIIGALAEEGMDPYDLVIAGAVLALVTPLLLLVYDRVGAGAPGGKNYTVHSIEDGSVVCRVEDVWIYRGSEEKASWYLRGNKVFSFAEKQYLYRLQDGQVFRRGESQPCMFVREDTVYTLPDSKPIYQTVEQEK